jgi:hypothetical protein
MGLLWWVVNSLGCKSTNFYIVGMNDNKVLVDAISGFTAHCYCNGVTLAMLVKTTVLVAAFLFSFY